MFSLYTALCGLNLLESLQHTRQSLQVDVNKVQPGKKIKCLVEIIDNTL